MIPAELYYTIYLVIITFMTLIHLSSNRYAFAITIKKIQVYPTLLFTVLMTLFIGFRPISDVFADMPGYAMAMVDRRFEGLPITWDSNYLFQPMMAYLSSIGASERTPIIILAIINFGCTFVAIRKMFPKDVFLAMLVFFGAFSTFGAATNGLKAGCAAAMFLIAIAYREKWIVSILFLFASMGFHHSMQLPIAAFILCYFFKKTKIYLLFWGLCLLLSIAHVTTFMGLFADFTDEHGADYLLTSADSIYSEFGGKTGFRYDFVLYSVIPIFIGLIALFKKKIHSVNYQFILNVYLLINAIWMICMYASYTNRIAYLSWLLYPVLLIYPFLNMKWGKSSNKILHYIVLGHLAFTLFMHIIYYI